MRKVIEHVYVLSLKEKGCLEYRWYQSAEKAEDFLLFMTWESKKAFEDHLNAEHVQQTHRGENVPNVNELISKRYQDLLWNFLVPPKE